MKKHPASRILALVLAAVLVLGLLPAARAESGGLRWNETDAAVTLDHSDRLVPKAALTELPGTGETVRVSIVLEDAPTAAAGFSTMGIAENDQARAYDRALENRQKELERTISRQALGGERLDVVWNLTLAANLISANVPAEKLDAIRAVPGVREVRVERQYSPQTAAPQTAVSAGMTGASVLWQAGLTGAGSRIAIIDTGTDTDHQSFDSGAFLYALSQNARDAGMAETDYLESLDLLDAAGIAGVLEKLNVTQRVGARAEEYYLNEKLPFAANYVDGDLTVDHDSDNQGSHGSHVAGIAAANRFIPQDGGYADALTQVQMTGAAPDAQILTMKVFGNAAGPYDSDYFAAIEDAIWLGCDSVNLSLGSGSPGNTYSDAFADLLEFLETTDTVVVMSAGNSGHWAEQTAGGLLYTDGVSFHTGGEPGTYTNALTVASVDNDGAGGVGDEFCTMSDFSSWGVPGSLELKPEITAPGGGIRSVNGMDPSGTGYEVMSGTSMAAPQVAGMAALLAQHIREQRLEERTGLSARQLAQSLLMSTAVPLREAENGGAYYPVLRQGAGLARVDLAAASESCVLVAGMDDGKVKAELGEDPDRTGEYRIRFSIRNFGGETQTYQLRADLFTQGTADGYLDTMTRSLGAKAEFTSGGVPLGSAGDFRRDLNGNGVTNAQDADWLLEYLVGNETALYADGDVSGDGVVNSYDAHVLLTHCDGGWRITVPAGGQTEVEAVLTLTEETRLLLAAEYPAGAYIQGFLFAEPISEAEGGAGVSHSIPILGYYGSWTEPGMFDIGSYPEYAAGTEERTPYLYALNGTEGNSLSIDYGDGTEYYFGGNPVTAESTYLPRRNAINSKSGASLKNLRYSLIRNADNGRLVLENAETGEVYLEQELGGELGAYYHTNAGVWQNTQSRVGLGLDLAEFEEGTTLELRLEMAPELYRTVDGDTDWEALGDGASFGTTFTIDNTAPQVLDVTQEGGVLRITARDDQYIAAVALMNPSGTGILTAVPGDQETKDTVLTAELDLSAVYGRKFLAAVFDYAENVTTVEVELALETERPRFTAIDRTNAADGGALRYVGLNTDGTAVALAAAPDRAPAQAAAYVGGAVFEVTEDGKLYVGYDEDLLGMRLLRELDPEGIHQIRRFLDLSYDPSAGNLYGIFYSDKNDMAVPYLCSIDLYTGAMEVLGELPVDVITLAIDGEGNFYSAGYGVSRLYTYRADAVSTGKYTLVGQTGSYRTSALSAMVWDRETDTIFWTVTGTAGTDLVELDPETAQTSLVSHYGFPMCGLYIAGEQELFAPTDTVSGVMLPRTGFVLAGGTMELSARVFPWNVRDQAVSWSSSDPSVASVTENGRVTGIGAGTAVITAASRLDPTKTASCTVTVTALDRELNALIWDEEGTVWFGGFHTDHLPEYRLDARVPDDLLLATTAVIDGTLYAGTLNTAAATSELYRVDSGYALTKVGGSSALCYTDLVYAPGLSYLAATYFNYIALVDPATGEYVGAFDWSGADVGDLIGITWTGSEYNEAYQQWTDTFLILDSNGRVYQEAIMPYNGSFANFYGPGTALVAELGEAVDTPYFQGFHFDGSYVYWTRFHEAENTVELRVWDALGSGAVYSLGRFPEGVWPVGGLYTDDAIGSNALSAVFARAERQSAAELLTAPGSGGGLNGAASRTGAELVTAALPMPGEQTNGAMTVTYDPAMLELIHVSGTAPAFAWNQTEPGRIRIAYAAAAALTCDTAAELTFRPLGEGETVVGVCHTELDSGITELTEEIRLTLVHNCPSEHFEDLVKESWWHEAVDYVVEKGYMNGMDATHFGPGLTIDRAQFITVLYRMEGQPAATNTGVFTDVPDGYFYTDAAYWALSTGITTGTSPTTFYPGGKLTRTELVTFMYRYARLKGYDISATADLGIFRDEGQIPEFGIDAWHWAVTHGIVNGMTADTLVPGGQSNRSQAAVIFQRFDSRMRPEMEQ